jgi:hypothetical protein
MGLFVTLRINDTQYNNTAIIFSVDLFIMLDVVILSDNRMSVVKLNVVRMNVVRMSVIRMNVVMLSVVTC